MKRSCLGCRRLGTFRGPRCDGCRRAKYRERQHNRDPREIAFYGSAAWRNLARAVVDEADACATCGTSRYVTALTGGHRVSIRQRPDLALSMAHVVAQCRPCQERMKRNPDPRTWPEWARRPRGAPPSRKWPDVPPDPLTPFRELNPT
jgi:hypothetical protein